MRTIMARGAKLKKLPKKPSAKASLATINRYIQKVAETKKANQRILALRKANAAALKRMEKAVAGFNRSFGK